MNKKQELLDLKSDWVFKRIFGKEGNEDILLDLLTSILNIDIKKVELKNTELTKNMEKQKKSVLDIKAILNDNSIVDIEMQVENEYNMRDRSIQHLTKLYSEQLEKGKDYTETGKVIIIEILGYNLLKTNSYHTITHLKHETSSKETYIHLYDEEETTLTDKLEIHTLEIPKFLKANNNEAIKLVDWMQLISGERELIKMALSKKAKKIEKAYKELQYLSQDEKARAEYDEYIEAQMLESMKINYAIKQNKIETVKEMLKLNMTINVIAKITKLTEQEIEDIKKKMQEI